jgi:hypothetical protein
MKPRLLDLCCCAGGCSRGYADAGFEVVGVDIAPQPNYPFEFHQSDALEFLAAHADEFDAIHASPPCQHYANVTKWRGSADDHPDLVAEFRDALNATGLPWVMENVPEAPLRRDYFLCGSMFGLPIRRHRVFEVSWPAAYFLPAGCRHSLDDLPFMHKNERAFADGLGCDWMSAREGRQAIPPAYTEFIGGHLLAQIERVAA